MGISIYYTATRSTPLIPEESAAIDDVVSQHSVDDQIVERERTGVGPNWESFCVYDRNDPTKPNVIFEGATRLPDNSEDAMWIGLQHWCEALSAIRLVIPSAHWEVRVDDHEIQWDGAAKAYDPSA